MLNSHTFMFSSLNQSECSSQNCIIEPGIIKNTYLCALSVRHRFYVPYCTFRCSFKEKCPLNGAKTQVKYVNPGTFLLHRYRYTLLCFYYVATGTYSGGSEFKYRGLFLKANALLCCKRPTPVVPNHVPGGPPNTAQTLHLSFV